MANKKEAYLYLSAALRAREPKLLSNDRAERMLDAASFEEAAKMLTDCGYDDMSGMNAGEIDSTLSRHRAEVFAELQRTAPDTGVIDAFRMKYDYHNAKAVIKAEAMGLDPMRLLSASGRVPADKLMNAYNEEHWNELPPALAASVQEAKSVLARTANPQLADIVLDRAYFAELSAQAKDSSFLTGYVKILIDSTNLKSAVRTIRMGKDAAFLESVLLPGGNVSHQRIQDAPDGEALAALFGHTLLEKAAALGAEAASGGAMTSFELACDNAVVTYLRGAKLISFGVEPLVAYLAAVEGEITAVRMILTGKLSGIAPEVIKERLRDLYA